MSKQIKKGLALVLAFALVFGVPQAFGMRQTTVARAASINLSNTISVDLSTGSNDRMYQTITADGLRALVGATATATIANREIAGVALDSDLKDKTGQRVSISELKKGSREDGTTWNNTVGVADATTNINIKAFKAGTTTLTLQATDGAKTKQDIIITVSEARTGVTLTDETGRTIAADSTISLVKGNKSDIKVSLLGMKTPIGSLGNKSDSKTSGYRISDETIATATFKADTFTFFGVKEGTTDVSLVLAEDNLEFRFHIKVITETQFTTTINGKTYTYDGVWKSGNEAEEPVIYLDPTDNKATLNVVCNSGSQVYYSTVYSQIVVGNTGTIEVKPDVTGKVVAGTYYVEIKAPANPTTGQKDLSARIPVVVCSRKAKLPTVEVKTAAGQSLGKASAKILGPDVFARGEATGSTLRLSVKDKLTESLFVDSNVDAKNFVTIVPTDTRVVTYANGVLTAVAAGSTTLTVTAKPDVTSENCEAVLTIPVTVSAKNINNTIKTVPLLLNDANPSSGINAAASGDSKLSYPTLARVATSTDTAEEQRIGFHDYGDTGLGNELFDVYVDANGIVTYKKNGRSGVIYVKITGTATDTYEAPEPVYVKVTYGDVVKKDSDLKVAGTSMEIYVGDVASAGAVSTQGLTYVSDKPEIASVDSSGVIKGLSAGTAIITITAAENDVFKAGTASVRVDVIKKADPTPTRKENPMTVDPKKVTVKYATVKKKNVTVSKTKAFTIKNAKGSVTFAKANKKWPKLTISKAGKITVKKGCNKGSYTLKVKVKAAGNNTYNPITTTVSVKIKVK